ncbi:hypothetical protein BH10ACI4_BH10ACI4_36940 [soil metagenome]
MSRSNLGAETLGSMDSRLAFNVHQHKIIGTAVEERNDLCMIQGRINIIARESKYLIPQRAEHFASANMKNCGFRGLGSFH